ncbi:hypothetical protein CA3LBN_004354 [Candidozyma haemuli]|uniref:Uncharacterized protein n=1 Tax=Candidozyma haemuli TaxID=45357 RepID=A0ABX8IGJ8_9ASCO|nr:hypothetical protein CA3LBN_004354 [[Candida] haemuloni]
MIRVPNLPSLGCGQQESVLWKEDHEVHNSDPVSASKFSESESSESELDLTSLLSTATLDDANSVPLTTPTTHSTHESTASLSHNRPHSFDPLARQPDYSCQEKYLQLVEPTPVFPPQYHTLPPGGCPRFPVSDDVHPSDDLPAYTPAAYKIGIVARVSATTKRLASQGSSDAKELAASEDNNETSISDKSDQPLDDGNEDINNLSDLHRSDEDEDEDDDDDEVDDDMDVGERIDMPTYDSSQTTALKKSSDLEEVDSNEKPFVNPESSESERRFLKNCIKCIKPLCFDEPWINKTLVKATYIKEQMKQQGS